jgi:tetratricopeptide (TPR) repeat protein
LSDTDGDGRPELLFTGGTISSVGAGVQRAKTEVYRWNGTTYELTQTIPDPVASQHPYWKLMDGNIAMNARAYDRAIPLFQDALAAKPPYPPYPPFDVWGTDPAVVVAAARFQLMLAYVELGNQAQAVRIYQAAQQHDGPYATWTRAFWDVYQARGDIQEGCAAARAAARDVDLPGYNYENHPLGASGSLCYTLTP